MFFFFQGFEIGPGDNTVSNSVTHQSASGISLTKEATDCNTITNYEAIAPASGIDDFSSSGSVVISGYKFAFGASAISILGESGVRVSSLYVLEDSLSYGGANIINALHLDGLLTLDLYGEMKTLGSAGAFFFASTGDVILNVNDAVTISGGGNGLTGGGTGNYTVNFLEGSTFQSCLNTPFSGTVDVNQSPGSSLTCDDARCAVACTPTSQACADEI